MLVPSGEYRPVTANDRLLRRLERPTWPEQRCDKTVVKWQLLWALRRGESGATQRGPQPTCNGPSLKLSCMPGVRAQCTNSPQVRHVGDECDLLGVAALAGGVGAYKGVAGVGSW